MLARLPEVQALVLPGHHLYHLPPPPVERSWAPLALQAGLDSPAPTDLRACEQHDVNAASPTGPALSTVTASPHVPQTTEAQLSFQMARTEATLLFLKQQF